MMNEKEPGNRNKQDKAVWPHGDWCAAESPEVMDEKG